MRPDRQDVVVRALSELVPGGVHRGELDRGGRMLRWVVAGTGVPTVVLDAGARSPATTWAAVLPALAARYRVIAYDRASYGVSDPLDPVSLDGELADLLALLREAADGRSIVVGHSWGGLLAQLAAWIQPGLIAGLVLVGPSHERMWLDPPPGPAVAAERDQHVTELVDDSRSLAEDSARAASADPTVQACLVAAHMSYLSTQVQVDAHLLELPMIVDSAADIARRRATAEPLAVPVALFTATKGRPKESSEQVIALQDEVIRGARLARHTVVPDAGHYIHIDKPDLIVNAIDDVVLTSRALARTAGRDVCLK